METGALTVRSVWPTSLRIPTKRLGSRILRRVVRTTRVLTVLRIRSLAAMPRALAHPHGREQSLADPAISWQAVSKLVLANRSPRCSSVHAIDRTTIEAFTSQA